MSHPTNRARRLLCIAAVLALSLTTLFGCSAARPVKSTEEELTVVALCDEYEVLHDELRYITLATRDEYTARHGADWRADPTLAAAFEEEVLDKLKINAAIMSQCDFFGIDLDSDEIQDAVQSEIANTIETLGGRKAYISALEELYMTDRFVRLSYATDLGMAYLANALIEAGLIEQSEADFLAWALQDDHICETYHIYIENSEGESVEDNRARAEEVRALLLGGEDIKDLIGSAYNEDSAPPALPYCFMKGEYDMAYEEAAFALAVGEVSDVVETPSGFYVIVRQELKESHIVANIEELYQRYQYVEVEGLLAEQRDLMELSLTDVGKKIDLLYME